MLRGRQASTIRQIIAAACGAILVLTMTAAAFGRPQRRTSHARGQFRVALARYDKKDFEAALPLFKLAWKSSKSPNAQLYVARCLLELGRLRAAQQAYRKTFRQAQRLVTDGQKSKYAATRDAASAELALLYLRTARLHVQARQPTSQVTITVNGKKLRDAPPAKVVVKPGSYTVTIQRPDGPTFERSGTASAGEEIVVVEQSVAALSAATSGTSDTGTSNSTGALKALRVLGYTTGAIGVAAMATFITTRLLADKHFQSLQDNCPTVPCTDPAAADTIAAGRRLEDISQIALGTGILGLAAGIPLTIISHVATPKKATSTSRGPGATTASRARLTLRPFHAGLMLAGSF
jgi:hypothetical protein